MRVIGITIVDITALYLNQRDSKEIGDDLGQIFYFLTIHINNDICVISIF